MKVTTLGKGWLIAGALAVCSAGTAEAAPQSKAQQKCITGVHKAAAKVASTAASNAASCVKAAAKGGLPGGQTADDCLTADNKGKLVKAKTKVIDTTTKSCASAPDFGPVSSGDTSTAVVNSAMENVFPAAGIFGDTLDAALVAFGDSKVQSGCQADLVKNFSKVLKAQLGAFNACAKSGLGDGSIGAGAGLAACVGDDPKGKVEKAFSKAQDSTNKKCAGVDIATLFPGDCSAAGGVTTLYADCMEALFTCQTCLGINLANGTNANCDLLDNEVADDSCVAPPPDYTPGVSSYVNTLTVPATTGGPNNGPTCCTDFGAVSKNGTGTLDNALATLAVLLGGLGADVGALLTQAIVDGEFVLLLDHQGVDTGSLPDDFSLVGLTGAFAPGTDFTAASAGTGEFLINTSSFVPGSDDPVALFGGALIDVASMDSGTGTLQFSIPLGFVTLSATIFEAQVSGSHTGIGVGGIEYSSATLSGYMLASEIFEQFNTFLNSDTCACLGTSGDVFTLLPDGSYAASNCATDATACVGDGEDACVQVGAGFAAGGFCTFLPGFFYQQAADIDTNDNPSVYEGLSIGLELTAKEASIIGFDLP